MLTTLSPGRWLSSRLSQDSVDRLGPMKGKPSAAGVTLCAVLAVVSMGVAVYFGGTNRVPLAMIGTVLFVLLGGLTFELARRRSL